MHDVLPSPNTATRAELLSRALVDLTRRIWSPECTFESAVGAICETSAAALRVERVSVWHYDAEERQLRCMHTWDGLASRHGGVDDLDSLVIDPAVYMETLEDVRTAQGLRLESSESASRARSPFPEFIRKRRVHSVLDAPACLDGNLQGAICHESTDPARTWSREERTFAGSMGDYVAMAYEIARRRRAETQVEHLRLHDDATGLPNRDYMVETLRLRLSSCTLSEMVPLLVISIDCSSVSSAPHASSAEDVTVRIAEELKRLGGSQATIARVHSSKFCLLINRSALIGTAIMWAERCLRCISSIKWEHAENVPRAAVGIVCSSVEFASDAGELLRQAEEAAHRAQLANRNSYEVFEPAHHEELVARSRLLRALRDALANGDFEVFYQPEYDFSSHQWVAAEALIRWHQDGVLRSAQEFVGAAEESGLMVPIGNWVLHRACLDAASWPCGPDGIAIDVRVNVSAQQFDDDQLFDQVVSALEKSGLAPSRLCLEITETTLMGNIESALVLMRNLRNMGVKLAIDDFGTGYASLVYLKRFTVDLLKIDRAFVADLPLSTVDAAIVAALVGLAKILNIEVVAEGVETVPQQAALSALGVRRQQGWLHAMAMPHAEWLGMMQRATDLSIVQLPMSAAAAPD